MVRVASQTTAGNPIVPLGNREIAHPSLVWILVLMAAEKREQMQAKKADEHGKPGGTLDAGRGEWKIRDGQDDRTPEGEK